MLRGKENLAYKLSLFLKSDLIVDPLVGPFYRALTVKVHTRNAL